jgi:hypothetical protein
MITREVRQLPPRVLLLDEDRQHEAEAERVLRAEGFEVLTVRTGDEALRNAAAQPVDLILLSASASQQEVGLFLETFATLPRARPVPILLAGARRPLWAWEGTCSSCPPVPPPSRLRRRVESVPQALPRLGGGRGGARAADRGGPPGAARQQRRRAAPLPLAVPPLRRGRAGPGPDPCSRQLRRPAAPTEA